MGFVGGLLGLKGGAAGTGFDNPQQANIRQTVNPDVLEDAYGRNRIAMDQQNTLLGLLNSQYGTEKQTSVYNQFQDIASGRGPNPAQAMLNQETAKNVSNQAALMAGQRGASGNVGLMARQAAQVGGGLQQQAVGQGATMQANQSLGALNQMGGLANTMTQNQMNQTNAIQNAAAGNYGNMLGAVNAQNQANVSSQASVNAANAGLAGNQMQNQGKLLGGIGSAVGSVLGLSGGGEVPVEAGPQSSFGQFLSRYKGGDTTKEAVPETSGGGMVDVVLSPGEKVVPPSKVKEAASGNVQAKTVPGKAEVPGDSIKNDTYKTKLPEGSIVVPRTKSKNPRDSAAFVRKTLAKRRGK